MRNLIAQSRAQVAALRDAILACDGNRGAFSCSDVHDVRCPKSRSKDGSNWRGDWVCECGREELDAALTDTASAAAAFVASVEAPLRAQLAEVTKQYEGYRERDAIVCDRLRDERISLAARVAKLEAVLRTVLRESSTWNTAVREQAEELVRGAAVKPEEP